MCQMVRAPYMWGLLGTLGGGLDVYTSYRPGLPGSGDRGRRSPQRPHARCRAPAQHTRTTRPLTRAPRHSRVDNHESNRVPCVHNRVWLSSRIVNRVTRARRARELRTRNTRAPEPRERRGPTPNARPTHGPACEK